MRLQSCLIMWSIGFEIEFLENCNVSICTFRIYFYPKGFLLQDWMLFFSVVQIGRPFWLRNGWKKVNFRMQKCTEEWICKAKEIFLFYFSTTISNGQAYIESLLGIEIASLKRLHSVKISGFFYHSDFTSKRFTCKIFREIEFTRVFFLKVRVKFL